MKKPFKTQIIAGKKLTILYEFYYIYNPIKGFTKEMTVWWRGKGGSEAVDRAWVA